MSRSTRSAGERIAGRRPLPLPRFLLALFAVTVSLLPPVVIGTQRDASAATLPAGFVEETVLSGLSRPTTLQFAGNGQVFVAEQGGAVKSFDDLSDTTPTVITDLSGHVHNFWDRGLLGMALHPQFPATPHVYVLYTHDYNPNTPTRIPAWGDTCPNPPGATGDGCVVTGRLSRLDLSSGSAVETVLIQDWCQQYPSHSIGQLVFGSDGALYASAGDGASFNFADYGQDGSPVNPCGDPPGGVGATLTPPTAEGGALRSQDLRTPSDPVTLDGTVIRIDPATGRGLPDNPLAGSSDENARRIVAHGLRNPFRFTERPGTGEMWIGDVGWGSWEEINRLLPRQAQPVNFGWPCYEGPSRQSGYDGVNLNICEDLYAQAGAVTGPHFSYRHGQNVVSGETCTTGSSSTSGLAFQFYSGGNYPAEYHGALFFADYSRNCIWVMEKDANGIPAPGLIRPFVQGAAGPVDLKMGPDQNLYYADLSGGTIKRIRYTGTTAPPAADCQPPTETDLAGVDVGSPAVAGSSTLASGRWTVTGGGADIWNTSDQFHYACRPLSGDGSITARVASQTNTDPWAKAGVMMRASASAGAAHGLVAVTPSNGVAFQYRTATGAVTTHVAGPSGAAPQWVRLTRSGSTLTAASSADGTTWTTIGSASVALGTAPRVGLAVTSHNNATSSTAVFEQVALPGQVTNTPPVPTISSPTSTTTWSVGQNLRFSGSATDSEDGALPATSLRWDLVLKHCGRTDPGDCHDHLVQSFTGTDAGDFVAPDHEYPSHLELRLTATDSRGASTATAVTLLPKTVELTFATSPSGLSLVVGSESAAAPFTRTFIQGAAAAISATSPQTVSGTTYAFQSWSQGGAASQTLVAPATPTQYTATFAVDTTPPPITLTARGYKVKGVQKADLMWSGAVTTPVSIRRDGVQIATVSTTSGSYTDDIKRKGGGTYRYVVCNGGTDGTCSPEAVVVF